VAASANRGSVVRAGLAVLGLTLAGAVAPPAIAGRPNPSRQHLLDTTVRFLQESQRPSGGFAQPGRKPSQSISAWVALAIASAGVNPQDQATCGVDAYTFLEGHFQEGLREELAWPQIATTAFERELLVVDATGTDPHDFAGYDLVAEIASRQLPNGSFPYVPGGRGEVNDTAFAVLALSPIREPAAQEAVRRGAEWLIDQQNDDGGWSWEVKGGTSEVDLTGGTIEALNAAGRHETEAQERALGFLHHAQRSDGGFAEFPSERESNVASTAWAVQGLWAAGLNPETWRTGSGELTEEPLDYMESLQQLDGHVRWKRSSDLNGIWMTAYVAPAFAGQALPVPTAPRLAPSTADLAVASEESELPPSCREPTPGSEGPVPGAESPKSGAGVISGGGGEGAPDFSRPKPQSKGKTPGGARIVHEEDLRAFDHSKVRRGPNTKQPTGTESSEPESSREEEVSRVAATATSGSDGGARGGTDGSVTRSTTSDPTRLSSARGLGGHGSGVPAALAKATAGAPGSGDREVTGTLIGSSGSGDGGDLAFGAPGLRGAGTGGEGETWLAIGIGAAVLLAALGGMRLEWRREEALP
jgi:Squalene-hopene cyclase C-terminal domain